MTNRRDSCVFGALWITAVVVGSGAMQVHGALMPHDPWVPSRGEIASLARVRALLATRTAARPDPVHIVFYGQSISLQSGWTSVAAELQRLYPSTRLRVENRSMS